jgi:hypothetical protein
MTQFRKLVLTSAATAVVAVAVVAAASPSGSTKLSGTQTLQFLGVQQSFAMLPQVSATAPPQVGGRLIFTNAIYNHAPQFGKPAGARVGRSEGVCTIVALGSAQCVITTHVPNGEIVAIGAIVLRQGLTTNTFAIVGGAGTYANARGSGTSRDISQNKTIAVLHLST